MCGFLDYVYVYPRRLFAYFENHGMVKSKYASYFTLTVSAYRWMYDDNCSILLTMNIFSKNVFLMEAKERKREKEIDSTWMGKLWRGFRQDVCVYQGVWTYSFSVFPKYQQQVKQVLSEMTDKTELANNKGKLQVLKLCKGRPLFELPVPFLLYFLSHFRCLA